MARRRATATGRRLVLPPPAPPGLPLPGPRPSGRLLELAVEVVHAVAGLDPAQLRDVRGQRVDALELVLEVVRLDEVLQLHVARLVGGLVDLEQLLVVQALEAERELERVQRVALGD